MKPLSIASYISYSAILLMAFFAMPAPQAQAQGTIDFTFISGRIATLRDQKAEYLRQRDEMQQLADRALNPSSARDNFLAAAANFQGQANDAQKRIDELDYIKGSIDEGYTQGDKITQDQVNEKRRKANEAYQLQRASMERAMTMAGMDPTEFVMPLPNVPNAQSGGNWERSAQGRTNIEIDKLSAQVRARREAGYAVGGPAYTNPGQPIEAIRAERRMNYGFDKISDLQDRIIKLRLNQVGPERLRMSPDSFKRQVRNLQIQMANVKLAENRNDTVMRNYLDRLRAAQRPADRDYIISESSVLYPTLP